jgi:hypothetical protein
MTHKFKAAYMYPLLFLFGTSYATDTKSVVTKASKKAAPVTIGQLLTTKKTLSPTAGGLTIASSDSVNNIHVLKAFFYNTPDCSNSGSNLLGEVSVTDNTLGFTFNAGETVWFNESAAYTLIQNVDQTIPASQVQCMALYLNGGTASNKSIACTTFPEDCHTNTLKCNTSNTSPTPVTWSSLNEAQVQPCAAPNTATPSLYVVNGNTGNTINQYKFGSGGTLSLVASTAASAGVFSIAANNGYANVTNSVDTSQFKINAVSGNLGTPTSSLNLTVVDATQIVLSAGYYYIGQKASSPSLKGIITFGTTDQSTGGLNGATNNLALNNGSYPNGVAVSSGYIYITDTSNARVYVCPINTSIGSFGSIPTTLGSCVTIFDAVISNPNSIAIYNGYVYIGDQNNTVYYCKINGASLDACVITASIAAPTGIAFYNGYAYISNSNTAIASCPLSTITPGALDTCSNVITTGLVKAGQMAVY